MWATEDEVKVEMSRARVALPRNANYFAILKSICD